MKTYTPWLEREIPQRMSWLRVLFCLVTRK